VHEGVVCIFETHRKEEEVGIAIIMVAAVKYARVSTSIPTVNMWWAHTINPIIAVTLIIA